MSVHLTTETLKSIYLFASLSQEELVRVAQFSYLKKFAAGETIFDHGKPADAFYWVQSGKVKIFRLSPDGEEKVFKVFEPGRTFAEALMFSAAPAYHVNAEALQESYVLVVNANEYRAVLSQSVESCFQLMGEMSGRMQSWLTEIDNLTLKNANYRLAYFLQEHIQQQHDNSAVVQIDMPKHVLASRLSVKPETLSRLLKQLQKSGVIDVEKRSVTILDMVRFKQLLDEE